MDSKYIITPDGNFMDVNDLCHSGIKGMRWGVRRYQNPDGSLTAAGKKRYLNSDGTLTKKGEKYYTKEKERLQSEKKLLTAQKRSTNKLSKLEDMRKKNSDLKDEVDGKKKSVDEPVKSKRKSASDMDDKELQDKVNRLRNEDAYRDLSKKLGYDSPQTELDAKIENMEKQKRYLELQRDINNLTPKNESRAKKIAEKLWNKVIEPVAIEAGKDYLKKTLGEAGKKTITKEAENIEKTVKDSSERVKRKKEKKEAKEAQKQTREAQKQTREEAKKTAESSKVYKGTVEGEGTSRSTIKNESHKGPVIDVENYTDVYSNKPITSLSKTSRQRGYEYIDKIKTDYGYRYVYELPAPKDDD